MRRAVISTFLFVAILGLGCTGVAVPVKAEELKHPIELGAKCKAKFEIFLSWDQYYRAFAYAHDAKGSYACAMSKGTDMAIEYCNRGAGGQDNFSQKMIDFKRGSLAFPSGINGRDLGGCKIYAKSPVNGKVAFVWKEEAKQVVKTEPKRANAQQPAKTSIASIRKVWAGYKTHIANQNHEITIRYSNSGEKYFARVSHIYHMDKEAVCNGSVDEHGNLSKIECSPYEYPFHPERELLGHVSRIELTSSSDSAGAIFVDKKLAQRIKAEADGQRIAEEKARKQKTKQVAKTEPKMADTQQPAKTSIASIQKIWAGYKTSISDQNFEITIRYSNSGEKYFARVSHIEYLEQEAVCNGSVDKHGNLSKIECSPYENPNVGNPTRELLGHVSRIELTSGEGSGDAVFIDKKLAQRIKAEADRQRIAEEKARKQKTKQVVKTEPKRANAPDRKLFAKLAPGAKTYLGDVMAFLQSNPATPILLDASLAAASLDESLATESGKAVKASLEELQQVVANSDDFAKHKVRQEAKRKQQRMNRRAEAIAELKTYKQFLSKLLVRSLSKKDGTTKALASMIKTAKAGLKADGPGQAAAALRTIKKQIKADAKIKKTHQQAEAYLKAEKQRQAQAVRKAVETKQQVTKKARSKKDRAKLAKVRKANRYSVAVIIGNKNYQNKVPMVAFAHNDADAMRDFVVNKLGYDRGNIIDLRDVSQADLMATFGSKDNHRGKLFSYVRPGESDVVVFYSGHGVPGLKSRKGYLLPVNADPDLVELNGYPIDVMLANLRKIDARSTRVFVDACFSGDSPNGMLIRSASGITIKIKTPEAGGGMTVVTAAQGDQFASWDEDAKHGLFTKHLLEALNGKADGEDYGNQDGKVTLAELRTYLDDEMTYQARRRYNRDQKASVQGKLDSVLATLR